jgi:hypothetical protein
VRAAVLLLAATAVVSVTTAASEAGKILARDAGLEPARGRTGARLASPLERARRRPPDRPLAACVRRPWARGPRSLRLAGCLGSGHAGTCGLGDRRLRRDRRVAAARPGRSRAGAVAVRLWHVGDYRRLDRGNRRARLAPSTGADGPRDHCRFLRRLRFDWLAAPPAGHAARLRAHRCLPDRSRDRALRAEPRTAGARQRALPVSPDRRSCLDASGRRVSMTTSPNRVRRGARQPRDPARHLLLHTRRGGLARSSHRGCATPSALASHQPAFVSSANERRWPRSPQRPRTPRGWSA